MGGYVIYIDGFIDLAKAISHKMARAWGWSEIIGGEFSSYTQFIQAYGASCRANLVSYKCNKGTVFKSGK